MTTTVAAGNAHAKTGTLRYVNTLSGYVTNRAGEQFVFSLMLNPHGCDTMFREGVLMAAHRNPVR